MKKEQLEKALFSLQDTAYRDFQGGLLPTVPRETMIGVRTPDLKKLAKQMGREEWAKEYLSALPHRYFEENQLHAFMISDIRSMAACAEETCRFLPYVDNWATCDQLNPQVFRKNKQALLPLIDRWIASGETYTVRFGIRMLMAHFLEADFSPAYPEKVAAVRSEEYYVNMMIAWYFATALAKRYNDVLPFITEQKLDVWTHNKAIGKAVESRRITPAQKAYLKSLKRK